jgi:hypothetical protein
MTKSIQYKDTTVLRGSQLYELLTSDKPEDKKKAEALYKQVCTAFDKTWDPKYNHLRNWCVGNC